MKIKFNADGKWADPDVNKPQIEVKAGDVRDLSPDFAQKVMEAGRGELVQEEAKPKKDPEPTKDTGKKPGKGRGRPPKKDKEKADQS